MNSQYKNKNYFLFSHDFLPSKVSANYKQSVPCNCLFTEKKPYTYIKYYIMLMYTTAYKILELFMFDQD